MKRKQSKILLSILTSLAILVCCIAFPVAADSQTIEVTLRIEGIENSIFYEKLSVPLTETLTVQDVILYADSISDKLTIQGAEGDTPYITTINGDTAGKFGGWDGWLFTVNGEEAVTGIQDAIVDNGDSILLYYGDPYGIGMQYPQVDTSDLNKGILRFFSIDTTYDSDWNPVKTKNPVTDMKVLWDSSEYKTDNNGEVLLDAKDITLGKHSLAIEKKSPDGAPLILRLVPDYQIELTEVPSKIENTDNPDTSDNSLALFPIILIATAITFISKRRYA